MKNQPALKTTLLLIAGIIAGSYLEIPFHILFSLFTLLTLITFVFFLTKKAKPFLQIILTLSICTLGILRYYQETKIFPPDHIINYINTENTVVLRGYLTKDPSEKPNRKEIIIETEAITLRETTYFVSGKILIPIYQEPGCKLRYGDEISLTGQIRRPGCQRNPGAFNYRAYLERKGIYGIMKISRGSLIRPTGEKKGNIFLRKVVYPCRRFAISTIDRITTGEGRSILLALIVGERGTISPEVRDNFAKAGIIHVLAVSGLHVGFVLLIITTIFGLLRFPYSIKVLLTILGLVFYALLTEAKAPVVRATTMAVIYLTGTLIERRTNPFNVIGVAAFGILFLKPQDLFDVGFQLSFSAVFSIVYFYQKITAHPFISKLNQSLSKNFITKFIFGILIVSLAAQIGTLPFTAVYFNRVPILALVVNIFAIPITGLIVALGFTSVLFSIISTLLAEVYGALNQQILSGFIKTISFISDLPFSCINIPTPDILHITIYFSLLLLLINCRNHTPRKRFSLILLILLNIAVWKNVFWNYSDKITWIQFDVGQGDAALFRLPRGKTILIDGGDKNPYFDNGERIIAPYLRQKGIRRLDAVILTHPHNDHIGGLGYILNNFKTEQVITAGTSFESEPYQNFQEIIENKKIPLRSITAPDSLTGFPGVRLIFLSPGAAIKKQIENLSLDINNSSIVLKILFGKTRLMLMGDAEKEVEEEMILVGIPLFCDALKVGHHGSSSSSTYPFLQHANPAHAIISVGEYNRFGHPSDPVIERYRNLNIDVHRTDKEGAVIFRSNGNKLEKVEWK